MCLGKQQAGLVAYSRILAPGTRFDEPSIGRVSGDVKPVVPLVLGRELMQQSIDYCRQCYPDFETYEFPPRVICSPFYSSLGFQAVSGTV